MIFSYGYDIGCTRSNNEDYYYVPSGKSPLQNTIIVADGMGGHNAGEVASRTAVEKTIEYLSDFADVIDLNFIRSAIRIANSTILKMSKQKEEYKGMGTTLTIACFKEKSVLIGHVGDSRAYIISDGKIKQLTKDHSYVQMLIDKGDITLEEAYNHPYNNVITRAVGVDRSVKIDTFEYPIKENDIIFLCTDGLSKYVSDEEIKEKLENNPQNGIDDLVNLAKERGGEDNITAIAARYKDVILNNRYKLVKHLGSGGMSDVYCAMDLQKDKKYVSIKILKHELFSNEKEIERFKEEAKILLKFKHKNIPTTYELIEENDKIYLVYDYIEGYNLKEYISKFGAIDEKTATNIVLQISRALRYVHNCGYIHKDVKPQNILLDKNLDAYLIDFGLATKENISVNNDIVLGSVYYFSPEQARGEAVTARSDIYSLGIVLYEMLVGEPPFKGTSIHRVIDKHLNKEAESPHDINRNVSVAISQVVLKAISKDKEFRYVNFNSFIADIKKAQKHPDGGFVTYQAVPLSVNDNSFGWKKLAVSSAVIVCLFGMIFAASYMLTFKTQKEPQGIVMPSLKNMTLDEATAKLTSMGLGYQIEYYENDNVANGVVIHQSIKENSKIVSGNSVILGVALNSKNTTMPNFYRANKDEAVIFLENSNITNIEFIYVDSELPFNFVVDQYPKANENLGNVSSVKLYISNNHISTIVPDLTGLTLDKARTKATESGFSIGIIYEEKNRNDKISKQFPLENQKLSDDLSIDLWVGFDENKKVHFEHSFDFTVKDDNTKVIVCYEEDDGLIYYVDEFTLNKGISHLNIDFYAYTNKPKNIHIFSNNIRQEVIENVGVKK